MMNKNNYAVIMAGGIGSRFWPMSKSSFPKQFLDILGTGETLIQQTFNRLERICPPENILIVTNTNNKNLCLEQLPNVVESNILCEPAMRNTAPCVAYAAFKIQSMNEDANMIIASSDHIILKEDEFVRVTNDCLDIVAKNDVLLTLGITPSRPDTGYGYIQFSEDLFFQSNLHFFLILRLSFQILVFSFGMEIQLLIYRNPNNYNCCMVFLFLQSKGFRQKRRL